MRIRRHSTKAADVSLSTSSISEICSQQPPTSFRQSEPQYEGESEAPDQTENASAFLTPSAGDPSPMSRAALSYTGR